MTKPVIMVDATFLTKAEGGRSEPPVAGYRAHLVMQAKNVRDAGKVVGDDLPETYLGFCILSMSDEYRCGEQSSFRFELMYSPQVDYAEVVEGGAFTIREGPHVVGYGRVRERY